MNQTMPSGTLPIQTALLSYGMSGKVFHAPFLMAHPGFVLNTIVRHRKPVDLPAPGITVTDQLSDVLDNPAIELIVVNTPNETHFAFATEALRKGKHVIVEKPFTVTSQEAKSLMVTAREVGRVLTVFQSRRWDGDFLTVKRIIEQGKLGRLVEYEARYDRYRTYVEPNTWKEEATPGTGILYNLGSHMIDQALVLFGLPDEVEGRVGIQRSNGRVDDYYDIRMFYPGFHAILKSSYLVREQGPRYVVHGVSGSFVKYGIDPQEEALKVGKLPGGPEWGVEPDEFAGLLHFQDGDNDYRERIKTDPGNYMGFYQNIFEGIRFGKPLAVRPEESMNVIRVIEACYRSNRERRAVKLSETE